MTEAVLGLVLGQVAGSIAVTRAALTVYRVPGGGAEPLGEDREGDRPLRDPVEHRLGPLVSRRTRRPRSCSARSPTRQRSVTSGRPGAADRAAALPRP